MLTAALADKLAPALPFVPAFDEVRVDTNLADGDEGLSKPHLLRRFVPAVPPVDIEDAGRCVRVCCVCVCVCVCVCLSVCLCVCVCLPVCVRVRDLWNGRVRACVRALPFDEHVPVCELTAAVTFALEFAH
jgi:hypothetical protein